MSLFALALLMALLAWGCSPSATDNRDTGPGSLQPLPDSAALGDLMKPFAPAMQTFSLSPTRPATVTGAAGTKIHVAPKDLQMPDGSPVSSPIEVSLVECTSVAELLGAGLQTVSDGRLLETGGSYYIDMRSQGQQLSLREGKSLAVEFPQNVDEGMELFYGEPNASGQMNWIPAGQDFEPASAEATEASPQSDTIFVLVSDSTTDTFPNMADVWDYLDAQQRPRNLSNEEKRQERRRMAEEARKERVASERNRADQDSAAMRLRRDFGTSSVVDAVSQLGQVTYQAVDLDRFGWYNCDRYMQETNAMTVSVSRFGQERTPAKVYLVSASAASIISLDDFGMGTPPSAMLPRDSKWDVILLSKNHEGQYCYARAQREPDQSTVQLPAGKVASEAEIKELFARL